jgi:hypothetical protein
MTTILIFELQRKIELPWAFLSLADVFIDFEWITVEFNENIDDLLDDFEKTRIVKSRSRHPTIVDQ